MVGRRARRDVHGGRHRAPAEGRDGRRGETARRVERQSGARKIDGGIESAEPTYRHREGGWLTCSYGQGGRCGSDGEIGSRRRGIRNDGCEQAVLFIREAGSDVKGIGIATRAAGIEKQIPQSRCGEDGAIGVFQLPQKRARVQVKGVNRAVAEVADKERTRKRAEGCGSNGHTPRSVERSSRSNATNEAAVGVEEADESGARSVDGIVFEGVLLREGHYHLVVGDNLDAEWGESSGNRRIHERSSEKSGGAESGIVGLNISRVEIRGQNEITRIILNDRQPFIDRPHRGIVYRKDGVIRAIPTRDRSVFGSKDEMARFLIDVEPGGDAVDAIGDDSCGGGLIGTAPRRRHNKVFLQQTRAVKEPRGSAIVAGDPERLPGKESHSPGVEQIRIGIRRQSGGIRDQVGLLEAVGLSVRR